MSDKEEEVLPGVSVFEDKGDVPLTVKSDVSTLAIADLVAEDDNFDEGAELLIDLSSSIESLQAYFEAFRTMMDVVDTHIAERMKVMKILTAQMDPDKTSD